MKLEILTSFRDKNNFSHVFKVGEIVEFDDERSAHVIELGLAKPQAGEAPIMESPLQKEMDEVSVPKAEKATEEPVIPKRRGRKPNQ